MSAPAKWEPGPVIWTYGAFEDAVRTGRTVFMNGHRYHARWAGNMSYMMVTRAILGGRMRLAVQRDEYREWLRDELLGRDRQEWDAVLDEPRALVRMGAS